MSQTEEVVPDKQAVELLEQWGVDISNVKSGSMRVHRREDGTPYLHEWTTIHTIPPVRLAVP